MNPTGDVACGYMLVSPPPGRGGAIALIELRGAVEEALRRLNIARVPVGRTGLRTLAGVDEGVVARWSETSATLCPHAGPAVVAALTRALEAADIDRLRAPDARTLYPEARDEIEAEMLAALARAASPLAVDLLLDQPGRWAGRRSAEASAADAERARVLNRLIDPPLVAAVGRPNIGKSTLLNALAKRAVALTGAVAGTTRDHVGVMLDLGGLVVRYVDLPGFSDDPAGAGELDRQAQRLARPIALAADLVVLCADARTPAPAWPNGQATLRVGLRADLGPGGPGTHVSVSALTGEGLGALSAAVLESLVPRAARESPEPWRFW